MRLRPLLASVFSALVVQMLAAVCCAQSADVATGRAAFERAALGVAFEAFHRVLDDPNATRADIVNANRYLSTIHLAQDDPTGAEAHATIALALNPGAHAPDGASPDVGLLFSRVLAHRGRTVIQLGIALEAPLVPELESIVRVEVTGLPPNLLTRVGVRCSGDHGDIAAGHSDRYETPLSVRVPALPNGAPLDCVATLGTPAGAVLERRALHATVGRRGPNGSVAAGTRPSRPLFIGAIAGGVVILAAMVVVVVVASQPYEVRFGGPVILEGP